MSEAKRTPGLTKGNWEAFGGHLVRSCVGEACVVIAEIRTPFRKGTGLHRATREEWRNLQAMAAAKDLLDAARAQEAADEAAENRSGYGVYLRLETKAKKLRIAAIAKAEGRAK